MNQTMHRFSMTLCSLLIFSFVEISGEGIPGIQGIPEARIIELANEGNEKAMLILALCGDLAYDEARKKQPTAETLAAIQSNYVKWYSIAAGYGSEFALGELIGSETFASGAKYHELANAAYKMALSSWDDRELILGLGIFPSERFQAMGISRDDVNKELLQKLDDAAKVDPHAALLQAAMLQNGFLLPIDEAAAKRSSEQGLKLLIERAADIPEQFLFLGDLHVRGGYGIAVDTVKAAGFYREGMNKGVTECGERLLRLGSPKK